MGVSTQGSQSGKISEGEYDPNSLAKKNSNASFHWMPNTRWELVGFSHRHETILRIIKRRPQELNPLTEVKQLVHGKTRIQTQICRALPVVIENREAHVQGNLGDREERKLGSKVKGQVGEKNLMERKQGEKEAKREASTR